MSSQPPFDTDEYWEGAGGAPDLDEMYPEADAFALMVAAARLVAQRAHAGQLDKAGRDYFASHVCDVAMRVGTDPVLKTVAYLHDVLEDTSWTADALEQHLGFPRTVYDAVRAITHRPNEPRDVYYARVKANPIALAVKLADVASNTDPARMAALDENTRHRLTAKYEYALNALTGKVCKLPDCGCVGWAHP